MSSCRFDRATKAHLMREHKSDCVAIDCRGCKPCTHDQAGNPVRHCRTRLRCTSHLEPDHFTCPECLAKIRSNLTAILDELALMPFEALVQGINSEPANLAGPHADYVTSQWRLVNASRRGEVVDELDLLDPYTCLTMHERTIREDLGHDQVTLVSASVSAVVGYLDWVLTDLARDQGQTLALVALLSDTARLRVHIEGARRNGKTPERGVPCPDCVTLGIAAERLTRTYGHWCRREGCKKVHYLDDSGDIWRCPVDPAHEWTHAAYSAYVEDRRVVS